jgi:glycosyltransferase involved in cell wall biosynthesis
MTSPFEKYILFFGRLENKSKNFDLLLEAFSISAMFNKGYHLKIVGSGPDLEYVKNKIKSLQLDDFVELVPFTKTPFEWVSKAKFTVLSSRYEGFPMSIIESLAHGTPVVTVDCNSGPREVIRNEYNGMLVENNNPQALANAMNQLIDDVVLYDFCKNNAAKSVEHLSLAVISKQWEAILLQ